MVDDTKLGGNPMNDTFGRGFRIFALLLAGALALTGLTALGDAFAARHVPVMWLATRSLGLLAYVASFLSTVFGVLVSKKGSFLDRALVFELHSRWSVAAVVVTGLHVLLAVADPRSGVTPLAALVPFVSKTLTGAIALGTLATWGMLLVSVTTALHRNLPRWVWRAAHASAFGTFVLGFVHGLAAGTDTQSVIVRGMYVGTAVVLAGVLVVRISATRASAGAVASEGE
jgi:methionine sulfoxide reductase heme-binding subunit